MYTGFILHANEQSEISKVNMARHNFGYDEEDVVVVLKYGTPVQIETLSGIAALVGIEPTTLEAGKDALLAYLNNPPEPEVDERDAALELLGVNVNE